MNILNKVNMVWGHETPRDALMLFDEPVRLGLGFIMRLSILKTIGMVFSMFVCIFHSNNLNAATLLLNSDQKLIGAENVSITGLGLFNVEFKDDSCLNIFSDCTPLAPGFDFTNLSDAEKAVDALFEQVLVDNSSSFPLRLFDSNPEETFGCSNVTDCFIFVPYIILTANTSQGLIVAARSAVAQNEANNIADRTRIGSLSPGVDFGLSNNRVYADFTRISAVPLPAAFPLFGTGLAIIGYIGWRRKRKLAAVAKTIPTCRIPV